MLRTRIIRSLPELDQIKSAWEALYRAGGYTLFQSFAWNRVAAGFCGGRLAVAWSESDVGAAVIPGVVAGDHLTFIGHPLFDYPDVLVQGDISALCEAWKALSGLNLPLSLAGVHMHRAKLAWEPLGFRLPEFAAAPRVVSSEISVNDFAIRHRRSARLLRKLSRAGAALREYSGDASDLLRAIYRHKAGQFAGTQHNIFADPARAELLVALAALDPAACRIFTVERGASLIAALVCFADGRVRRFYTIAYDPAWAAFSPGVALLFEITRRTLAEGFDCDYMTGEQPHKLRFATSRQMLLRVNASAADLRSIARHDLPQTA